MMGHSGPNSFATYRQQASRPRLSGDGSNLIATLRDGATKTATEPQLQNGGPSLSNPQGAVVPMKR